MYGTLHIHRSDGDIAKALQEERNNATAYLKILEVRLAEVKNKEGWEGRDVTIQYKRKF